MGRNQIRNEGNFSSKNVRTIKKELLINGGDLDLYLDLFITDPKTGKTEQVLTKKADSILANFLRILYLQMGRKNLISTSGTFYGYDLNFSQPITGVTVGSGIAVITINSAAGQTPASGKCSIMGVQGTSDMLNVDGTYNFTKSGSYGIAIQGNFNSGTYTSNTGYARIVTAKTNPPSINSSNFGSPSLFVGIGKHHVQVDDQLLQKEIPNYSGNKGVVYNSMIVSQDTNDSTSAQITFTRTFTNAGSLNIKINEIGMTSLIYIDAFGAIPILIMRDIIPNGVNVNAGKVLTVNYRLKTNLNSGMDPGGFLPGFMRLLYRQFAQASRSIFDVQNVARVVAQTPGALNVLNSGGNNIYATDLQSEENWKYGITVGSNNNPVSMGDFSLNTIYPHGNAPNQLLYYGGYVGNWEIGSDFAQFDIVKAIENDSGSTLNINEYGLNGGDSDSNQLSQNHYLYQLSRNTLTAPIEVPNGQILKCIYTIRTIVTGGSSS